MAVEHVKSVPVTNADATPIVPNTTGEGGLGSLRQVDGFIVVPASASIDSTLRFVRVPTTAKIKTVTLETESQTVGVGDVGVYYPASLAHPDLAANAVDQDFFASAVSLVTPLTPSDVTNESTTYNLSKRVQPLWQAVGLTSDPGGYFDIVITITTAVTTGGARTGLRVTYVD